MKEFNTDKLFEWRNTGVQYIGIHHYVPELSAADETSEFMVSPFLVADEAQRFLTEKLSKAEDDEPTAAIFFIDSAEALEIATGMITCKFYVQGR